MCDGGAYSETRRCLPGRRSSKNFDAMQLILSFKADVYYQWSPNARSKNAYVKDYYAKGADCDKAFPQFSLNGTVSKQQRDKFDALPDPKPPITIAGDLFPRYKSANKTKQCILRVDATDNLAPVSIDIKQQAVRTFLYDGDLSNWIATDINSNKMLASVTVGKFYPLKTIPFVIAGCFINDAESGWQCGASIPKAISSRFMPGGISAGFTPGIYPGYSSASPTANSPAAAIAHAMGLAARKPTD
jgi:hypothetical protein